MILKKRSNQLYLNEWTYIYEGQNLVYIRWIGIQVVITTICDVTQKYIQIHLRMYDKQNVLFLWWFFIQLNASPNLHVSTNTPNLYVNLLFVKCTNMPTQIDWTIRPVLSHHNRFPICRGFCVKCAAQLQFCPLCRGEIVLTVHDDSVDSPDGSVGDHHTPTMLAPIVAESWSLWPTDNDDDDDTAAD